MTLISLIPLLTYTAAGAAAETAEKKRAEGPDTALEQPVETTPDAVPSVQNSEDNNEATTQADSDAVLVDSLNAVVLIGGIEQLRSEGRRVGQGIHYEDLPLDPGAGLKERLEKYIGKPVTVPLLKSITADIVAAVRAQGYLVADALAPSGQDITNGVVQFVLVIGKRGKVVVQGAEYFSADKMSNQLRGSAGEMLRSESLKQDLAWLNRNPFRTVNLQLAAGDEPGSTDLILDVEDRMPVSLYAGYNDTGTELTGERRWLAGVNWGNAFGLEHQLNYQYLSSADSGLLSAHSLNYSAPLPWRDTASISLSRMTSKPQLKDPNYSLEGKSSDALLRYSREMTSWGHDYELTFGYDYKRSNNNLAFGQFSVYDSYTEVSQFNVSYGSLYRDSWGGTDVTATLFYSPGGMFDDNSDESFDKSRSGAVSDYSYLKLVVIRQTPLPLSLLWHAELTLQFADENLLGSEQLGLGGSSTVRGYEEFEVVGDRGYLLRNELRSPPTTLLPRLGLDSLSDELYGIFFVEGGQVSNAYQLPDEQSQRLLSAGLGLRYRLSNYLNLRLDYGSQLEALPGQEREARTHFALNVSY